MYGNTIYDNSTCAIMKTARSLFIGKCLKTKTMSQDTMTEERAIENKIYFEVSQNDFNNERIWFNISKNFIPCFSDQIQVQRPTF